MMMNSFMYCASSPVWLPIIWSNCYQPKLTFACIDLGVGEKITLQNKISLFYSILMPHLDPWNLVTLQ